MCSDGNHVTDNLSDNSKEEPISERIARKGQLSKYWRFPTTATTRTSDYCYYQNFVAERGSLASVEKPC